MRINAACRQNGLKYSQFINGMKLAGIDLDRKVLSDIAIHDEAGFAAIVKQAADAVKKNEKKAA